MGDLGLGPALASARQRVTDVTGLESFDATVHLDLPRWFTTTEQVAHLPTLAEAIRDRRRVDLTYGSNGRPTQRHLALAPLGLVNKAGTWYVVVSGRRGPFALRASQIATVRTRDDRFDRPRDFDLSTYWDRWSSDFEATRPPLDVVVRASAQAIRDVSDVFGTPFAAVHRCRRRGMARTAPHLRARSRGHRRLAGFRDTVEVVSPASVRSL